MEIKFYGLNRVKIVYKKNTICIDDVASGDGKYKIANDKSINIFTTKQAGSVGFTIDSPGEYEINEISVKGIPAKLFYDEDKSATMYSIHMGSLSLAVVGNTTLVLDDSVYEEFGLVDVLLVPVGGGGYTLDPVDALKTIKNLEPKIVVPTHYDVKGINYEVPQLGIDEFLKVANAYDSETTDNLRIKENQIPDKTKIVVINPQL